MKLLLASAAAALMATSFGASAADLAKKAPVAVDYVKVCDAYGAGFFYIPGTDTCLKIGGYVRADVVGGNDDFGKYGTDRATSDYSTRARLQLQVDARSNTEYGLLRSYAAVNFQFDSGPGNQNMELDQAYIQWGGLTAGKAQSYFDFFTGYAPAFVYGETVHDDKVTLLAYTFGFANGLSATVSVEDPMGAGRQVDGNTPPVSAFSGSYGGNKVPDVIGNLKLEQGWGTAQVMGVLHHAYSGTNVIDEMGFAVGAGVTIKLPTLGAKDEFGIQVAYADGAIRYLGFDLSDAATASYDFNVLGDRSKGWSGLVGYQHSFSSKIVGVVQGGYVSFDSASNADDYSRWDATAGLIWTPVDNLDISTFVEYRSNDFDAKANADGFAAGLRLQRTF